MQIGKVVFYAIPLASAFCNMFLLLTFMSVKKDKLIRSFMWLLLAFTLWPMASFLMRISFYPGEIFWCQVSVTSVFFVPLLIYKFVYYYTGRRGSFLMWVFTLGTFILAAMNLMGLFMADPRIELAADGQKLFLYDMQPLAVLPVLFSVVILLCAAKIVIDAVKKDGLSPSAFSPFFAGVMIMFAAILLDLIPGLSAIFPVDPFACMLNAILIYCMLYRKRLFTLTQLASNSSTYLVAAVLTSCILAAGFSGINGVFSRYLGDNVEVKALLTAILSSVLTILLFNLLKKLANNLFVKGEQDREKLLKNFSIAVSQTLDEQEILNLLTDLLRENVKADLGYVFIRSKDQKFYHLEACTDRMKALDISIDRRSPLIKWLEVHQEGIRYSEFRHTASYKSMWETEKRSMEHLEADVIFPVLCDENLIGVVILSGKQNRKNYTYGEISFIESVISVASIAVKNAQLYETIQEEARMDSLTNVYNRRYFCQQFDKIFEENRKNVITLVLINFDDFKLYNELYGAGEGDRMLQHFAGILKRVIGGRGLIGRYSGKEFSVCLPVCSSREAELLVAEIRSRMANFLSSAEDRTKKMLTFSAGICSYPTPATSSKEIMTYANMAVYACKKSGKAKTQIYSTEHYSTSEQTYDSVLAIGQEYASTIYALTAAIDAKDHYTFNHSKNVSYLATRLAQGMNMNREHVEMIRQAGLLHDIGKISVPESILAKTTRLTDEEYKIMQGHVENAISMIRHLPSLDYVIPIAISHHERYDGKGYPRGLSGENIPIGGRCLCIADSFDAIVSRRPYKEPVPVSIALEEIERNLGKQFDPVLGRKFVDMVRNGEINLDIYEDI